MLEGEGLRQGQGSKARDCLVEGVTLKSVGIPKVMTEPRKGPIERELTRVD